MVCSDNNKDYDSRIKEIKDRKKSLSSTLKELFDEALDSIECIKNTKKKENV